MKYIFRQSIFYPYAARSSSPRDYDTDFRKLKSKSRKYEKVKQRSKLKEVGYFADDDGLEYMYDVNYDISEYFEEHELYF